MGLDDLRGRHIRGDDPWVFKGGPGANDRCPPPTHIQLPVGDLVEWACKPGGEGGLGPDALASQALLGSQEGIVAGDDDPPARLLGSLKGLRAASRAPDADGGGDGLRIVHRMTNDQRGRACCLPP